MHRRLGCGIGIVSPLMPARVSTSFSSPSWLLNPPSRQKARAVSSNVAPSFE